MPSWGTIGVVLVAGFALSASPGPSMMYVLSRSIGQSHMAGLASALGLALGGVLLAVLSAAGLAVLFAESRTLFNVVSVAGGGYLLYLAYQMLVPAVEEVDSGGASMGPIKQLPLRTIVYQGILVELLNPKTVLFFVAFLPGFVIHEQGEVWLQLMILGMLVPLTAVPSDIVVSFTGGALSGYFERNKQVSRLLELMGALILVCLAIRVILSLR
jgi:threonine/homoserine/homoserine lactone efflux protein